MQVQKGSGIICVLMTIAGLLVLMSLVIRYTTYGIDIAHQRTLQEQRYFALKGLLNYGLMAAEKKTISDATIDVGTWLTDYTGNITITSEKDSVTVQAFLYGDSSEFITMQQQLKRESL